MPIVYMPQIEEYEREGYLPFVCFVTWETEDRDAAIKSFFQVFDRAEGKGIKGIHGWNLIGRNTLILIGWTNSAVSLQKFVTSSTYGTGIRMDVCPAIDHFGVRKALGELQSSLPNIPFSKG